MDASKDKWYFKTYIIVTAFLCVGPLALPLVWINPNYSAKKKALVSLVILFFSYLIWIAMAASINSILNYYKLMLPPSS